MRAILAAVAVLSVMATATVLPATGADAQETGFGENGGLGMDDADADAFFEEFMGSVERDKADRERCANTRDSVSKQEQYDACTRLIEDAPNENDLVGTYYVNRATAHDDHTAQCQDVTKGIEIIERENSRIFGADFLAAAKSLQKTSCY